MLKKMQYHIIYEAVSAQLLSGADAFRLPRSLTPAFYLSVSNSYRKSYFFLVSRAPFAANIAAMSVRRENTFRIDYANVPKKPSY